jgi:hypothetical protein
MQPLELIAYGPNTFGTHKPQTSKVVKIPKILNKMSVEDAKHHPTAKTKGRRSRQKEVGKKTKRKVKVRPRARARAWEEKRFFGWEPLFFPALRTSKRGGRERRTTR